MGNKHRWSDWVLDPNNKNISTRKCLSCNAIEKRTKVTCPNSECENGLVWEDWNYNINSNWTQTTCRDCSGNGYIYEYELEETK